MTEHEWLIYLLGEMSMLIEPDRSIVANGEELNAYYTRKIERLVGIRNQVAKMAIEHNPVSKEE